MADFCTVADLEAFLQIEIAEGAATTAAEAAIAAATAEIQGYCHQQIELVEDDEITLDVPAGRTKLFLPEVPVDEVGAVVEDGVELVEGDDYVLGQYGVLHRLGGAEWLEGVQTVAVTYTHGHDPLPADVKDICVRVASRAFQAGLRSAENGGVPGVTAMSLGDYSVSYGSEGAGVLGASGAPVLLPSEKAVLNRYRYVAQ